MAGFSARHAASPASWNHCRRVVGANRFLRRLRHHQHGSGRRFRDASDGDLCHGAARRQSGHQRNIGPDHGLFRRAHRNFRKGTGGMNRRTFFMGLSALAGCARDTRPRLNVYNWSSYIAPETIPSFEAEFGVRVRYATYESNEEMLAKVISGNSGWDIVFPTHSRVEPMRANGLLAPLRHEWLPGL